MGDHNPISERQEIELTIDRGYGEKKIIVTEQFIEFTPDLTQTLIGKYKPDLIAFGCSGYPPPFDKGSQVLKTLRDGSGLPLTEWKKIISLSEDEYGTFLINSGGATGRAPGDEHWGIWVCRSQSPDILPDLIALNYPFFKILSDLKKTCHHQNILVDKLSDCLSRLYRALLAAIDAYTMFDLGKFKLRNILMSDIGSQMLGKNKDSSGIQPMRINVFSEVIGSWIGVHPEMENLVISYGLDEHREGRLKNHFDLWGEQMTKGGDDEADLGTATDMRLQNANLCKQMNAVLDGKINFSTIRQCLRESAEIFGTGHPILATDALQARKLTEALTKELTEHYNLKSKDANLLAYIERLETSGKVSSWMTSYMHILRILGNTAAHYKKDTDRRPERPVGKDLTVIHAALGRILNFCLTELKQR